MKRYILLLLAVLLIPVVSVNAQGKKKSKKEVSPIIEGRQKVRKMDYENVWKFTSFNVKKKGMYFCAFDYTQIPDIVEQRKPDWQEFQPVVNFLKANGRVGVTIVAVYALNPDITEDGERAALANSANEDALLSIDAFKTWCADVDIRNKMVLQVAQVDYRYWYGQDYFNMAPPQSQVIPLGFIIALTNKKVDIFPNAAAGAPKYKDIQFLPNDATVVDSYFPIIDSVAACVMSNDRYEVCLTGYSDNVGTVQYNRGLSSQRATEIKKMLMQRGVPEYRIEIVARGEDDPVGDNSTFEGRLQNNRVSITIQ